MHFRLRPRAPVIPLHAPGDIELASPRREQRRAQLRLAVAERHSLQPSAILPGQNGADMALPHDIAAHDAQWTRRTPWRRPEEPSVRKECGVPGRTRL